MRTSPSLFLTAALASCNFPVSSDKYQVEQASSGEEASLTRLVHAFAGESDACEARLAESCRTRLEGCVTSDGCVDFAVCAREIAGPDASSRCSSRENASFEAIQRFSDVRECWATIVTDCAVGSDFRCVGRYAAPTPQRSPIVVAQTFSYVFLGTPVAGADVRFCALDRGCELVLGLTTDETGSYRVDIPIALEPPGLEGWRGVRRVDGAMLHPHLLARNIPIWSDHHERTSLMSSDVAQLTGTILADLRDVAFEDLGPIALVQAFDCQTAPAGGIIFEVPTAPDAFIVYVTDFLDPGATSTAQGVGSATIANLTVGKTHHVVARHEATGEVVASGDVFISGEEGVVLSLFPEPME